MSIEYYRVVRDLTAEESTYHKPISKDTVVYRCIETTYGCISPDATAVTFDECGGYPFFEIRNEYLMEG